MQTNAVVGIGWNRRVSLGEGGSCLPAKGFLRPKDSKGKDTVSTHSEILMNFAIRVD